MQIDIYCDESRLEFLESVDDGFMVIGSLWLEREKRNSLKNQIKELKEKHNFNVEIKWTKISYKMLDFYKELVDIFVDYQEFHFFKAIVVDTSKINFEYHQNNSDIGFYKFYYQVLVHKMNTASHHNDYYVYVDDKTNKVYKPLPLLKKVLNNAIYTGNIKLIEPRDSFENLFIQYVDVLIGLVSYGYNTVDMRGAKKEFHDYACEKLDLSLNKSTTKNKQPFNIFEINLDRNF
ncbi:MAG: DUF3800 domain-containing protein [Sulfurimonas sp.]|nr:DUF3800 domain-containing protein [Sulfurimonas sp.]